MTDILEIWPVQSASLQEAQAAILEDALSMMLAELNGDRDMVFASDNTGFPLLAAFSAKPHHDPDFGEWTVLWIMQAGQGHSLHVADHTPTGYGETTRIPKKRPQWSESLEVGSLVLFNGHRTHWLPPSPDGTCLIAGTFEFDRRPTHAEAETAIEAKVHRWESHRSRRPAP